MLRNWQWLNFEWGLWLKCRQDSGKFFAIFLFSRIVATKMDIHTPASQLGRDGAEASHFVGTHKHMTHTSTVFQIFQMIELVLERPTACRFGEMMCFIDDHRVGAMPYQGFFHRLAHVAHTNG